MESADASERKWACVAVSNLIQNDPSTRRLLQGKNIVGTLISRLTDSEEEVVVEAVGALRCVCLRVIFLCPRANDIFALEIYVSTVDMISVRKCTTKIS